MKILLVLIAAICLFANVCVAGPNTYIGLFSDDSHSQCSVTVPAAYVGFTAWLWILPSDEGMICAEFGIYNPSYLLSIGMTVNPNHSIAMPICTDFYRDCSLCFADCQTDWVWLFQISILPTEVQEDQITIGDGLSRPLAVVNCSEGYPRVPVIVLNHLSINRPCEISVGTSSWGAVKSIYSN